MADHIRKQIRDAAATALTGLVTTGSNVFSGRVSPLGLSELPAIVIYLNADEAVEGAYNGAPTEARDGMLRIEGIAKANDDTIDTLDQIAKEVEEALFSNSAFLALLMVKPGPPSAIISIDEPVEGLAHRLGSIILQFPIMYRTRLGDPDTQV